MKKPSQFRSKMLSDKYRDLSASMFIQLVHQHNGDSTQAFIDLIEAISKKIKGQKFDVENLDFETLFSRDINNENTKIITEEKVLFNNELSFILHTRDVVHFMIDLINDGYGEELDETIH